VKIRQAMAELAANGGAPMGRYVYFPDPEARKEHIRYYQFMRRYDEIYRANLPYGEAVLLHPRSLIHRGQLFEAMGSFQETGRFLLDRHVLFDVIPDELATKERLAPYRRVFTVSSRDHLKLESFEGFSRIEAPPTVRVSASRPAGGGEIDLHFVNYRRDDSSVSTRPSGIAGERPVPVSDVRGEVVIPPGMRVVRVEAMSPEEPDPVELASQFAGGRLRFTVPRFLVYSVVRIRLGP
jgi:hypothetical protein